MNYEHLPGYLPDGDYKKIMFHTRGAVMDLWDDMDLKYGYQELKLGFIDAVCQI